MVKSNLHRGLSFLLAALPLQDALKSWVPIGRTKDRKKFRKRQEIYSLDLTLGDAGGMAPRSSWHRATTIR
jgi:hypothetical protein